MQEQQITKEEKKTPDTKAIRDKITAALTKDDDLLAKFLKSLANPLVLIVAIPIIVFLWWWSEREEQITAAKQKKFSKEEKLRRKNKKLKNRLKKTVLTVSGSDPAVIL